MAWNKIKKEENSKGGTTSARDKKYRGRRKTRKGGRRGAALEGTSEGSGRDEGRKTRIAVERRLGEGERENGRADGERIVYPATGGVTATAGAERGVKLGGGWCLPVDCTLRIALCAYTVSLICAGTSG
ncbi:hypothetical protein KM043_016831 [Ampulex compressa]|nr:hypothetical protein KM043_016831 [Ampulex compressa]